MQNPTFIDNFYIFVKQNLIYPKILHLLENYQTYTFTVPSLYSRHEDRKTL